MAKKVTFDLVRHMGEVNGKPQWKNCGKVVHDDATGKNVLWINPAAMRNAIKGLDTDEGVPFLLFPKTGQAMNPDPQPAHRTEVSNPPGGVQPTSHAYNEPPMDFDDDIPF
jgi:hypothetical protein